MKTQCLQKNRRQHYWETPLYIKSGVNFINVLHEAFTHADPKSIKFQLSCHYLLTLFGSTSVKASQQMLAKLTPEIMLAKLTPEIVYAVRTIIFKRKKCPQLTC